MTDEEIAKKVELRFRVEKQLTVHPSKAWILLMSGDVTICRIAEFRGPTSTDDATAVADLLNKTAEKSFIPEVFSDWPARYKRQIEDLRKNGA